MQVEDMVYPVAAVAGVDRGAEFGAEDDDLAGIVDLPQQRHEFQATDRGHVVVRDDDVVGRKVLLHQIDLHQSYLHDAASRHRINQGEATVAGVGTRLDHPGLRLQWNLHHRRALPAEFHRSGT